MQSLGNNYWLNKREHEKIWNSGFLSGILLHKIDNYNYVDLLPWQMWRSLLENCLSYGHDDDDDDDDDHHHHHHQ